MKVERNDDQILVRLPSGMKSLMEMAARRDGVTTQEWIREALQSRLSLLNAGWRRSRRPQLSKSKRSENLRVSGLFFCECGESEVLLWLRTVTLGAASAEQVDRLASGAGCPSRRAGGRFTGSGSFR